MFCSILTTQCRFGGLVFPKLRWITYLKQLFTSCSARFCHQFQHGVMLCAHCFCWNFALFCVQHESLLLRRCAAGMKQLFRCKTCLNEHLNWDKCFAGEWNLHCGDVLIIIMHEKKFPQNIWQYLTQTTCYFFAQWDFPTTESHICCSTFNICVTTDYLLLLESTCWICCLDYWDEKCDRLNETALSNYSHVSYITVPLELHTL